MEPINGLILILVWGGVNALIAAKRKRSAAAFFGWSVLPVLPVVLAAAFLSQGNGFFMGLCAFAVPAVSFVSAIMVANGPETAARTGSFGDYVKCAYCAEPVRREAIKCRHCGSSLTPKPARKAA